MCNYADMITVIYYKSHGTTNGGQNYNTWNSFWQATKDRSTNYPNCPIYLDADAASESFEPNPVFRVHYYLAENDPLYPGIPSSIPASHRGKATLSRWHHETSSFVNLVPFGTCQECLDYLNFIRTNGDTYFKNAIEAFDIEILIVFTDSGGSQRVFS